MREVKEDDLRKEEFKGKNISDYEFRADGNIVRKDRWEEGIMRINSILNSSRSDFEIDDLVNSIQILKDKATELSD